MLQQFAAFGFVLKSIDKRGQVGCGRTFKTAADDSLDSSLQGGNIMRELQHVQICFGCLFQLSVLLEELTPQNMQPHNPPKVIKEI